MKMTQRERERERWKRRGIVDGWLIVVEKVRDEERNQRDSWLGKQ